MQKYIALVVIAVLALYIISTYNELVTLRNNVLEAFATMDVSLKKRWDTIPNLVEIVKGYTKHEKETLESLVGLRNQAYGSLSVEEKLNLSQKAGNGLGKLLALAEAYPELKANSNFLDLSGRLSQIEEDISQARRYYNGAVRSYNNKVQHFPSNLLAGLFGFEPFKMYEVNDYERENIKIRF